MDNVHGAQVVQEVRHCQDHEVVSDVEPVSHDVSSALLVDDPPDGAGEQGKRT